MKKQSHRRLVITSRLTDTLNKITKFDNAFSSDFQEVPLLEFRYVFHVDVTCLLIVAGIAVMWTLSNNIFISNELGESSQIQDYFGVAFTK